MVCKQDPIYNGLSSQLTICLSQVLHPGGYPEPPALTPRVLPELGVHVRLMMARGRLGGVIRVGLVLALVVAGGPAHPYAKRRQHPAADTAREGGQSGAPPAGMSGEERG